jgi:hypothetical protein
MPLLEVILGAFETIDLSPASVEAIWDHAYRVYDRLCRDADPNFTFEENRILMQSHLVGPRRLEPKKSKKRPR